MLSSIVIGGISIILFNGINLIQMLIMFGVISFYVDFQIYKTLRRNPAKIEDIEIYLSSAPKFLQTELEGSLPYGYKSTIAVRRNPPLKANYSLIVTGADAVQKCIYMLISIAVLILTFVIEINSLYSVPSFRTQVIFNMVGMIFIGLIMIRYAQAEVLGTFRRCVRR